MTPTTNDVLAEVCWSQDADHEWLHNLVGDWQLLADLSFADLALWVQTDAGWRTAAQVRPTTGVSMLPEDLVGGAPDADMEARLDGTFTSMQRSSHAAQAADGEAAKLDVFPVSREGRCVAVLTRHQLSGNVRRRGRLESKYLGLAESLLAMVASGTFPDGGAAGTTRGAPRVGDGVMALDPAGCVTYASPNAVSALRRLGVDQNVSGLRLATALAGRGVEPVEAREESSAVLAGQAPWHTELRSGSVAVSVRAVPLVDGGIRTGAALLLRDVTELRRRDRELITKDATIREVHHRVKNNLQTVAAVLRLQGRRVEDAEARKSLADAGRRVALIAAVHESLSEGFADAVAFDEVALRGMQSAAEVARAADAQVSTRLEGGFGVLASEDATAMAMVLGELVQNAVEHGLRESSGSVVVTARRSGAELHVLVEDDGVGLGFREAGHDAPVGQVSRPDGGSRRSGLGTQIVTTFVHDLHGHISWENRPGGGTRVSFSATLRPVDTDR